MAAPMKGGNNRKRLKRKPDQSGGVDAPTEKKPKETILNEIEFKYLLKEANTPFQGFERFLEAAEKWSEGGGEDIVLKYCRSSPECAEIFQVLETSTLKIHELQLVFRCLEKILLRIADDLGQFYTTGQTVVKKLLAGHSYSIFKTLNMKNKSNQIKATVKLLVSMVMLGTPSAKLVLNNVDLGHKETLPLLQRRDVKDEEDVRTCFIHLVVACLLARDSDVIGKLVQTKGLMENVFQGVEFDRVNTLQLLLTTIREKVIMNTMISKTIKVRMFTEKGLKELGHLYNWQGLGKWKETLKKNRKYGSKEPSTPSMEVENDGSGDKAFVAELADQFLTEVCTSVKHGIIFHDNTYGLSGRSQNHLMTSFLGFLSGQLSHILVQKLVIGILTACPDQLQYFFPHIVHSLVPRENSKWTSTMNFLMKVYRSLGQNLWILNSKDKRSVGDFVHILLVHTMPTSQVLNSVLPGIKDKSLAVSHVILGLVRQIADTAGQVIRELDKLTMYSDAERLEIYSTYKAFVLKNLPDVMSVFTCWDKAMTVPKSNPAALNTLQDVCEASLADVLTQIEQILCLYQDMQHSLLSEHPDILGKLIDGIIGSESAKENSGTGHMTKVYLLKLMAGTETKRLPWAKQNASGQSLLYQLLDMFSQLSSSEELADVTLPLVCKLLEGTGQFESHHDDLLVWLKFIKHSEPDVLNFVSMVMVTYIHNPYPYMDRLCDLDLQTDFMNETGHGKSPQINVKDILAKDAVDVKDEEPERLSASEKRFPFCPMLIVGLDMIEKLDSVPKALQWYVSQVVLNIFHQQFNPLPLCNMVTKYKRGLLVPGLHKYIHSWLEPDNSDSEGVLTKLRYEECLAMNEGLVSPDVEPKSRIQQDLLHLTYLIQAWKKTGNKRYLKQMKPIRKEIITRVREISLTENEENNLRENKCRSMHLQDLIEVQSQNTLSSVVRLVLEHPVCKHFFLLEQAKNIENQSAKIANIVTDMVTDLFKVISEQNVQVGDILDFYYQRISSVLKSATREERFSRHSVLKVLTVSVSRFSADQCCQMFDLVLNTCTEDSEEENALMQPLLKSLIQRLGKSEFKIAKLTESGFCRLINCFLNNDNPDGEILYEFFKRFPALLSQCSKKSFERLVLSAQHQRLLPFLIENNPAVTLDMIEIIQSTDLTTTEGLQIIIRYITSVIIDPDCKEEHIQLVESKIVKQFRSELLSLCESHDVGNAKYLLDLAELLLGNRLLGDKIVAKMKKRLLVTLQETEKLKLHHIDLLCMVYDDCHRQELLQNSIKCLIALHGRIEKEGMSMEIDEIQSKLLDIIVRCTEDDIQALSRWDEWPENWPKFIKSSLEFAYTKSKTLKFITSVLQVVYKQDDLDLGLTLEDIVALVIDNSSYLPVMFGQRGQECQDSLVSLLLVLTQLCPTVCNEDHVGAFLGGYGASLSLTDQKLLKLMHFYEKNQISFSNYKPFLWGEKAVEQHALRQSLGPSLKRATMVQVMSNINPTLMNQSILHFPLRRKLQDIEPQPAEEYKSESKCFDPCFILPLVSHLLEPECVIDSRRFVQSGCLGYTLAALSSHDEDMRNMGQHVLTKFQGHLEVAKVPEKEQLQYMLTVVQNSIPKTKNKLPSIITQFLARTAKLMLKPEDHMYTIINQFLLLKPSLDIGHIPEFFKLFNSSAMQYQMERSWILSLMKDGMRESADYWIYEKRFTFKLLQSFYHSKLADVQSQCQVLQILISACKERRLAIDLCQNHGFLIWIASAINELTPDKVQLCIDLCSVLDIVWCSVVEQSQHDTKSVQISFYIQILTCLKTMLFYVRNVPENIKLKFLKNLSSVLSNLCSVQDRLRGNEMQTVAHPEILLLLLHCQNHWTQSKKLTQSMKTTLYGLGLDPAVSKTSSESGKRNESGTSQQKLEEDIDKETGDDGDKITKSEEACLIVNEMVKILDLWKPSGDSRKEQNSAVDMLVIRWILDQLVTVKSVQTVFVMMKLVHRLILPRTADGDSQVLAYISGVNNTIASEMVVDMVNSYSVVADKYYSMCAKDAEPLKLEMTRALELLNDVLSEIFRRKYNLSRRKMDKAVEKRLLAFKVSDGRQAVRSVVLRQMFVEKL